MMFVDGNGVLHNLLVAVYTDMNEEEYGQQLVKPWLQWDTIGVIKLSQT